MFRKSIVLVFWIPLVVTLVFAALSVREAFLQEQFYNQLKAAPCCTP